MLFFLNVTVTMLRTYTMLYLDCLYFEQYCNVSLYFIYVFIFLVINFWKTGYQGGLPRGRSSSEENEAYGPNSMFVFIITRLSYGSNSMFVYIIWLSYGSNSMFVYIITRLSYGSNSMFVYIITRLSYGSNSMFVFIITRLSYGSNSMFVYIITRLSYWSNSMFVFIIAWYILLVLFIFQNVTISLALKNRYTLCVHILLSYTFMYYH